MATSLYKAQIPLRRKGQTTCTYHQGRQLDHYCEECKVPVCVKCVTSVHTSHPLCALSAITSLKKQDLEIFLDKTENVDLVQIEQYINSTDTQIKDNADDFEKLSSQLKLQTKKLKYDLDLLTARTLSFYKQMKEDNSKLIQTYKQDLEMYRKQLKQQLHECKKAFQRGSDIQIYDAEREIQSPVILPVKPTLSNALFTPNQHPMDHLEQALGDVSTSVAGTGQALLGHDWSVGSSAGQTPSAKQQSTTGAEDLSRPVYELLYETKVLEEWISPCNITSVCPTTDGQVWTKAGETLTLLNRKGKVIQEIKHDTEITDISMSPTTNTLWIAGRNNNITELVSGKLEHRFNTKEFPRCICATVSTHVIVGMNRHISKLTKTGKQVRTALFEGPGKSLIHTPCRISECPVTRNVAVADERRLCIVVMDSEFNELCVYDGEVPHKYQSLLQSGDQPFDPKCVIYDSVGNLVIGDYSNGYILLISGCGEFLRVIHTGDEYTCTQAAGIDREDVLWAAVFRFNSDFKLIQYSNARHSDKL